jgi:Putative zinc-finger
VIAHPPEAQLALFAGGDLGRWERWRIARHMARCPECRREVQALRAAAAELGALASEASDLPTGLNWNRLADEMTGNIRVGLAAGEAIAGFDKPLRSHRRLGWSSALVAAGATAIFAVAFWTSLPTQQADHLLASWKRIRTERIGAFVHSSAAGTAAPGEVVLEASSAGIQVRENGSALSLIPHSDGGTVSVNMHGSAGVRFVDADTGQVTTNKVYYAEQ